MPRFINAIGLLRDPFGSDRASKAFLIKQTSLTFNANPTNRFVFLDINFMQIVRRNTGIKAECCHFCLEYDKLISFVILLCVISLAQSLFGQGHADLSQ